jgi:hypothetical protein
MEDNIKKQVSLINQFGETMTLAIDKDNQVLFKHSDVNDEFEPYNDILVDYIIDKKTYRSIAYVLDPLEKIVLSKFVEDAINNHGFVTKTKDIPVIDGSDMKIV